MSSFISKSYAAYEMGGWGEYLTVLTTMYIKILTASDSNRLADTGQMSGLSYWSPNLPDIHFQFFTLILFCQSLQFAGQGKFRYFMLMHFLLVLESARLYFYMYL